MSNDGTIDMATSINLDKLDESKISTAIENSIDATLQNKSESTKRGLLAIGDKNSSTQKFELNTVTKNTIRDIVRKNIKTIQSQKANMTQIMEGMKLHAPCVAKGSTHTLKYGNTSVVKQVATTISKDVTNRLADMVSKTKVKVDQSNTAETKVTGLDAEVADMVKSVVSSITGFWILIALVVAIGGYMVFKMFFGGGGGGGGDGGRGRKRSRDYDDDDD